jgi:hypothetical protein
VSWSGPTHRSRRRLFLLPAVVALLVAPRLAEAGCQVPGRVILHSQHFWDQDQIAGLSVPPATVAPLILTNPTCPSEVPHVVDSPTAVSAVAMLDRALIASATRLQLLAAPDMGTHPQPLMSRLDRPPRRLPCSTKSSSRR